MENTIEESWRYDQRELQMMAEAGYAIETPSPINAKPSSVTNAQKVFQRSFMRIINRDGTETDGNGNPIRKRKF